MTDLKEILVVGLGAGSFAQLTLGVWEILKNSELLYLRTAKHPMVDDLSKRGIKFRTFDYLYEEKDDFEKIYEGIAEELLLRIKEAEPPVEQLVYAVPGHPLVGEKSVRLLLEKAAGDAGVKVRVFEGISFVDSLLNLLQIDLTAGFTILDALSFTKAHLNLSHHQIFTQVYSRFVASELKLTLLELYPPEHLVKVIKGAGIPGQEELVAVELSELDHLTLFDHLTSVYVPPLAARDTVCRYPLDPLTAVIDRLLAPDGCPWDREQNHVTLKKCLLEETYEVLEAIDEGDMAQLREELGDVLLQVAFHAALADRRGDFDLNEVVEEVTAKMIRRHPHVFGEVEVKSSTDVLINWEKIKKGEKGHNGSQGKMMDSVNKALPALLMAEEVQKKAKKVGFDWSEIKDPLAKVLEEYNELRELLNIQDQADQANGRGKNREGRINEEPKQRRDEAEDELGDLLFAVVNVARFLGVSAEAALFKAVRKFMRRFSYIEKEIAEKSLKWEDMDINSLDIIWERAKSEGL